MTKVLYLSIVGSSLTAVCNSIYFQINKIGISKSTDWILELAISDTSPQKKENIQKQLQDYKNEFETGRTFPLPEINEFRISEVNALEIVKSIESYLTKYENTNFSTIVFDITAGRKVMSVAFALSAIKFWKRDKNRDVKIAYFLLKNIRKNLDKKAPELYPDEYEIKTWSVEEVSKLVGVIQ